MEKQVRSLIYTVALAISTFAISAQPADLREAKPSESVQRFYDWYVQSLSQDRDPFTQDRAILNTYVSATLIEAIDRQSKSPDGLDVDYFLQTQDYLDEWKGHISVVQMIRKGAVATTTVTLGVKGVSAYRLTVRLRSESGSWKIIKVERYRN